MKRVKVIKIGFLTNCLKSKRLIDPLGFAFMAVPEGLRVLRTGGEKWRS